jgi:hypothetical protein
MFYTVETLREVSWSGSSSMRKFTDLERKMYKKEKPILRLEYYYLMAFKNYQAWWKSKTLEISIRSFNFRVEICEKNSKEINGKADKIMTARNSMNVLSETATNKMM